MLKQFVWLTFLILFFFDWQKAILWLNLSFNCWCLHFPTSSVWYQNLAVYSTQRPTLQKTKSVSMPSFPLLLFVFCWSRGSKGQAVDTSGKSAGCLVKNIQIFDCQASNDARQQQPWAPAAGWDLLKIRIYWFYADVCRQESRDKGSQ